MISPELVQLNQLVAQKVIGSNWLDFLAKTGLTKLPQFPVDPAAAMQLVLHARSDWRWSITSDEVGNWRVQIRRVPSETFTKIAVAEDPVLSVAICQAAVETSGGW